MVGCWFIRIRSSLSSGPSFRSTLSRMPILPMSCSSPAHLIRSISFSGRRITPAHRLRDVAHPARVVAGVRVAGVDGLRERLDRLLEQLPRLDVPRIGQPRREERNDEEGSSPTSQRHWGVGTSTAISHAIGSKAGQADGHTADVLGPDFRIGSPVRALTAATASDQLSAKKTTPATSGSERNDWHAERTMKPIPQ